MKLLQLGTNPRNLNPASFVIEVDQLKIKSRKPHHLESKMQGLKKNNYSMEHHRVMHQSKDLLGLQKGSLCQKDARAASSIERDA